MSADRFNAGKPELSYVPRGLVEGCSRSLMFGATKYARNNWKRGLGDASIMDSLLRHLFQYLSGEEFDAESGLCHLDHAAGNLGFLLEQRRVREADGEMGVDDILPK